MARIYRVDTEDSSYLVSADGANVSIGGLEGRYKGLQNTRVIGLGKDNADMMAHYQARGGKHIEEQGFSNAVLIEGNKIFYEGGTAYIGTGKITNVYLKLK